MSLSKEIKSEQWSVRTLIEKINNKSITKPKYQRKKKWRLNASSSKSNDIPNEKDFIDFLYRTKNSVHTITLSQNGSMYENIDGNNRLNAINHFLTEPFQIFPEKLENINTFIDSEFKSKNIQTEIKSIICKMTYNDLMNFRFKNFFPNKGYTDLYNKHLLEARDKMEDVFETLIKSMKINNIDPFDSVVMINVNLFSGYNTQELCDIFHDMNKYSGKLTETEILASVLHNTNDFLIKDNVIVSEINECLEEYYEEKSKNEILPCYQYDKSLNAFDFITGFQIYSSNKSKLIEKPDNDGLSLFFKIYKSLFNLKTLEPLYFNTENINTFISYIKEVLIILNLLEKEIFMENIVSKGKILTGCNNKLKSLKKNNMFLIISSILGYLKQNTSYKIILKSLEKTLYYHFLVQCIDDKDQRDIFKINDNILHEVGGSHIELQSKDFINNPVLISDKISKEIMSNLIEYLLEENIKNKNYNDDSNTKRRSRKTFEKALLYKYFSYKLPREYTKHNFWIEHIFPFSCTYDDEIDIDRLGNIILIPDELNNKRNNKHIEFYIDNDIIKFFDVIPNIKEYNKIVNHDVKIPHIIDLTKFNNFCKKNETKLKDVFLNSLY